MTDNGDPYGREVYVSSTAGIWLPAVQAIISGVIVGILALSLAMLEKWSSPALVGLAAGGVVCALVWFISLAGWRRIVYGVEVVTGQDIDSDHVIGDPVRVELRSNDGHHVELIDLPIDTARMVRIAQGLQDGLTLSESAWTGGDGILSRSEFSALRAELLRRGLAAWNSPRTPARGVSLTPAGRAIVRRYASMGGDPYPTLERRTP